MNRHIAIAATLTLALVAIGSSSASAQVADVPFVGVVGSACIITPSVATPGILTVDEDDAKTLTSEDNTPGTLTVLCNTPFDLQTGTPVESALNLTQVDADDAGSSIREINSTLGTILAPGSQSSDLSAGILYTVEIDMYASRTDAGDPNIEAGLYAFTVPVTVAPD